MGRYTTVQAYADNNPSMRAVSYDQATGQTSDNATASAADRGPIQTEKVDNPYGSTAGAGSGEFHVYRHARAREMARWKKINEDEAEVKAENEFQQKWSVETAMEDEKTAKRRNKRQRAKDAKKRKKNMKLGGVGFDAGGKGSGDDEKGQNAGDDEFDYTPIAAAAEGARKSYDENDDDVKKIASSNDDKNSGEGEEDEKPKAIENNIGPASAFPNDGSFLERMKKEMAKAE